MRGGIKDEVPNLFTTDGQGLTQILNFGFLLAEFELFSSALMAWNHHIREMTRNVAAAAKPLA